MTRGVSLCKTYSTTRVEGNVFNVEKRART